MSKLAIFVLIILFAAGAFLRFYKIVEVPPPLLQDEAITGYDAYAIAQTGHDHHGEYLPLSFRSFNAAASPFITYLLVPVVSIFGLSTYTIRLPIAFMSSVSMLSMFWAGYQLNRKVKEGLVAAFLLTFSSFAITTSRWAIPTYTVVPILLLGLSLFLTAKNSHTHKTFLYSLAFFFFGITLYTYAALKIFMLLFIPFILWFMRKERLIYPLLVFSIVSFPAYLNTLFDPVLHLNRFTMVSIFSFGSFWPFQFLANYLSYFLPFTLFLEGEVNPTRAVPGFGYELLVYLPFFYSGLYFLIKKRSMFLLGYLLLSPIGPSLTMPSGDFQRSIHVLPVLILISSLGFFVFARFTIKVLYYFLKTKNVAVGRLTYVFLAVLVILNSFYFLTFYFGKEYEGIAKYYFQYGMEDVVNYLANREDKFSKIVMTNIINMPYSYVLFFKKVDPRTLVYSDFDSVGKNKLLEVKKLGKYRFREVTKDEIKGANLLLEVENSPFASYQILQKDKTAYVVFVRK